MYVYLEAFPAIISWKTPTQAPLFPYIYRILNIHWRFCVLKDSHVYIYIYIRLYTCIFIYPLIICIHTYEVTHIEHAYHKNVYIYMYIHTYIHIYIYKCLYIYTNIYIYICIYIYIYIYIFIYIYVYMCIYINIYIYTSQYSGSGSNRSRTSKAFAAYIKCPICI
jgi:hypothetical protein